MDRRESRKLLLRIALVTLALVVAIWGRLALWAWQTYHAARYPGAEVIDAGDFVRLVPNLVFRRVETYRSTDPFNLIYNWYSQRFALGPERYATGSCLLMARSAHVFGPLHLNASVMVCDAGPIRMMFVQRTYLLRYPAWLQRWM